MQRSQVVLCEEDDSSAVAIGYKPFAQHFDSAGTKGYHWALSLTNLHTIMSLRIIATGGTFDKHYDELTGTLGFADSHLPAVLARTRMTIAVALEQLPLLDSLDMQDADRQRVLASCRAAGETAIV